jgi:uncharacterized membrane protein YidH (DUF202 family)
MPEQTEPAESEQRPLQLHWDGFGQSERGWYEPESEWYEPDSRWYEPEPGWYEPAWAWDEPAREVVAGQDDPQLALHQRLVDLSIERTRMSADRSRMSADRSRMSADRSRLSADRSRMSADRSRMSADRSVMSAQRSYMNVERTLSVWVRTALAVMVAGLAVDRFGLVLLEQPGHGTSRDTASHLVGVALVAFGALIAVLTGARHARYAAGYRHRFPFPRRHGPALTFAFALLVALFGVVLVLLLLVAG